VVVPQHDHARRAEAVDAGDVVGVLDVGPLSGLIIVTIPTPGLASFALMIEAPRDPRVRVQRDYQGAEER
jgi:hypothetical protein